MVQSKPLYNRLPPYLCDVIQCTLGNIFWVQRSLKEYGICMNSNCFLLYFFQLDTRAALCWPQNLARFWNGGYLSNQQGAYVLASFFCLTQILTHSLLNIDDACEKAKQYYSNSLNQWLKIFNLVFQTVRMADKPSVDMSCTVTKNIFSTKSKLILAWCRFTVHLSLIPFVT